MTLKTAVVAPIPRAREKMAVRLNPGFLRSWRKLKRRFGSMGGGSPKKRWHVGLQIAGRVNSFNLQGETICAGRFVLSGFAEWCPGVNREVEWRCKPFAGRSPKRFAAGGMAVL